MSWVLALTGLAAEPGVVTALAPRQPHRATDVVELLALAQSGGADGVLVSARFPQMTRDVALRAVRCGVPVWGLVDPGDDVGERTLQDWGVPVVPVADAGDVVAVLAAATAPDRPAAPAGRPGPLIAVLGVPGAPGATTVALNTALAWQAPALLLDADARAPAIGFHLGVADGTPGVRGAGRQADHGRLTPEQLVAACHREGDTAVLVTSPGTPVADPLLVVATRTGRTVVADCGADPAGAAPVLARADLTVVVGVPTALGVSRWLDALPAVRRHCGVRWVAVWNQLRRGAAPLPRLQRFVASVAPGVPVTGLPWDRRWHARRGPWRSRAGGSHPAFRALAGDLAAEVAPR